MNLTLKHQLASTIMGVVRNSAVQRFSVAALNKRYIENRSGYVIGGMRKAQWKNSNIEDVIFLKSYIFTI